MELTPVALVSFIGVCLTFLATIIWGRFRKVTPKVVSVFPKELQYLTYRVGAGIVGEELAYAISFWESLGWKFIEIREDMGIPDITYVVDDTIDERSSVEDKTLKVGSTRVTRDPTTGLILRSRVSVLRGADRKVLAHETGHALGLDHTDFAPTGHVTHTSNPGLDGRGCERENIYALWEARRVSRSVTGT